MTSDVIRILLLEDSDIDAELITRQLGKVTRPIAIERATDRAGYHDLLLKTFDLILSDYSLPDFNGVEALKVARERDLGVPFIFVSGVLGEEFATEALRAGATDYVTKKNLERIPMVVDRALVEAAEREERQRATEALQESERRFRSVANAAPALIWEVDARGTVTFANDRFASEFGIAPERMTREGWRSFVHEEDWPAFCEERERLLALRAPFSSDMRVKSAGGALRWIRCESRPRYDDRHRFLGYVGCAVDITDAKLARDSLEAEVEERTSELRLKEEALRQSQKMEAIGQLTGGIAHDFNNMLGAIIGSADLLKRRLNQGRYEDCERFADSVITSANRAAGLTQRLLAFSRRQTLDVNPIALEPQLHSLGELVRRTIGPSIELSIELKGPLWPALTDINQFESAVLNLAINARDAMPDGGRLVIGAENRTVSPREATARGFIPGDYVVLSMTDTGSGMDAETLAKAVDPFFTTKPIGQGTGLGLSMVYGFMSQTGGHLHLASEPGQGTTISLLLLRAHTEALPQAEARPAAAHDAENRKSTICVVEDEPIIRMVLVDHLTDLGYEVLEAGNADEALAILADGHDVDLLLTDVGLPGMNGRQLAVEARKLAPKLPVLFATGYVDGVISRSDFVGEGMDLVSKPYDVQDLTNRLTYLLQQNA